MALLLTSLICLAPDVCAQVEPQGAAIDWRHDGLEATLAGSQTHSSGVLVYFWMEGSEFCTRFYGETLSSASAVAAVEGLRCISADIGTESGAAWLARYSVTQLPSTLFLTSDGVAEDVVLGFAPEAQFASEVARIRAGNGTVSSLKRQSERAPTDLGLRLRLYAKLVDVGRAKEGESVLDFIRSDDPKGETVVGARLHLKDARDAVRAAAADASDVKTWRLGSLLAHVKRIRVPEVRFEGYELLGELHNARNDVRATFEAWTLAYRTVPDARLEGFAFRIGGVAWSVRDRLDTRSKRVVLSAAVALAKQFEERPVGRAEGTPTQDAPGPAAPAMDVEEEETNTLADVLELQARALILMGKRARALKVLDRALGSDPGHLAALARKAGLSAR